VGKERNVIEIIIGQTGVSWIYSVFVPVLLILWYAFDILNDDVFFVVIIITSFVNLYILNLFKLGVIPIFSYFFICGPGLTEYVIHYVSNGELNVAILAQDYITVDMLREYASASVLGGAASIIGFMTSFKRLKVAISKKKITNIKIKGYLNVVVFSLFAVVIIYFTHTQGGSIFAHGSYGAALEKKSVTSVIGVLNVIFIYFFFVSFILKHEEDLFLKKINITFMLISLGLLLFLASRGVRQDPFGVIVTVILIKYLSNGSKNLLKYSVLTFIMAWFFTVISGQFRYTVNFDFLHDLGAAFFKTTNDGTLFFNLDTASSVVGTFHVAYINIHDFGDFLYGQSYLDWLPRTLPAFIMPDRPLSLAWNMEINGEAFAMGGVQDIAEQYWNFGRAGVVFLSFLISHIVGVLSVTFLQKNSFLIAIPLVWFATLPRWHWYQTFVLYKGFLTILVLAFLLHMLYQIFILNKTIR